MSPGAIQSTQMMKKRIEALRGTVQALSGQVKEQEEALDAAKKREFVLKTDLRQLTGGMYHLGGKIGSSHAIDTLGASSRVGREQNAAAELAARRIADGLPALDGDTAHASQGADGSPHDGVTSAGSMDSEGGDKGKGRQGADANSKEAIVRDLLTGPLGAEVHEATGALGARGLGSPPPGPYRSSSSGTGHRDPGGDTVSRRSTGGSGSGKGGVKLSKRQAMAVRRRMRAQADAIRAMTVQLGAAMTQTVKASELAAQAVGQAANIDRALRTDSTCLHCVSLLREPVQLACGHAVCRRCAEVSAGLPKGALEAWVKWVGRAQERLWEAQHSLDWETTGRGFELQRLADAQEEQVRMHEEKQERQRRIDEIERRKRAREQEEREKQTRAPGQVDVGIASQSQSGGGASEDGPADPLVDVGEGDEVSHISKDAEQEAMEDKDRRRREAKALRRAALLACRPPDDLIPPPPLRCAACELAASIHARERGALSASAPQPPASDAEAIANALLRATGPGKGKGGRLLIRSDSNAGRGGSRPVASRDADELLASAPDDAIRRLPAPLRARLGLPLTSKEGSALRAAGISEAALRREGRRLADRFDKGEADTSSEEEEDDDQEEEEEDGIEATVEQGEKRQEQEQEEQAGKEGGQTGGGSSGSAGAAHSHTQDRGSSLYQRAVEVLAHAEAGQRDDGGQGERRGLVQRARKYHVHVMQRHDPHAPPLDAGLSNSGSSTDGSADGTDSSEEEEEEEEEARPLATASSSRAAGSAAFKSALGPDGEQDKGEHTSKKKKKRKMKRRKRGGGRHRGARSRGPAVSGADAIALGGVQVTSLVVPARPAAQAASRFHWWMVPARALRAARRSLRALAAVQAERQQRVVRALEDAANEGRDALGEEAEAGVLGV